MFQGPGSSSTGSFVSGRVVLSCPSVSLTFFLSIWKSKSQPEVVGLGMCDAPTLWQLRRGLLAFLFPHPLPATLGILVQTAKIPVSRKASGFRSFLGPSQMTLSPVVCPWAPSRGHTGGGGKRSPSYSPPLLQTPNLCPTPLLGEERPQSQTSRGTFVY